jgi:hypothetical protein
MRIQESLFGQGEGLLVEDNYATDVELERYGVMEARGAEVDRVVAICQAAFAARVCRLSVSDIIRDACERHLEELLFERRDRRRTCGGSDDDGDDDSVAGLPAGADAVLDGDVPSGDEFGDDVDSLDYGCDADAW